MPKFLILKLDGVMQGWGGHTYEDWRPTELFPTRSGLLGLLGACLGIDRQDISRLDSLASSMLFTIRADRKIDKNKNYLKTIRLCDYHTILEARKVDGKPNDNPVQSYRWYLYDALFTVIIQETDNALFPLEKIADSIRKPVYTPFLGRRSCPLSRPLLNHDSQPFFAESVRNVLEQDRSNSLVVYSESPDLISDQKIRMRDVPLW
jgi:CRISPR system Cascade subunit CasD